MGITFKVILAESAILVLILFFYRIRVGRLKKKIESLEAENKRLEVQASVDKVASQASQNILEESAKVDIKTNKLDSEIPKDTQELTDEEKISVTDITSSFNE